MTEAPDDASMDTTVRLMRALAGDCRMTDGWEDGEATILTAVSYIATLRAQIERLTAINAEQATTIAQMMRKGAA